MRTSRFFSRRASLKDESYFTARRWIGVADSSPSTSVLKWRHLCVIRGCARSIKICKRNLSKTFAPLRRKPTYWSGIMWLKDKKALLLKAVFIMELLFSRQNIRTNHPVFKCWLRMVDLRWAQLSSVPPNLFSAMRLTICYVVYYLQPNTRLCLSMSDFHPESWNPMVRPLRCWHLSVAFVPWLNSVWSFSILLLPILWYGTYRKTANGCIHNLGSVHVLYTILP